MSFVRKIFLIFRPAMDSLNEESPGDTRMIRLIAVLAIFIALNGCSPLRMVSPIIDPLTHSLEQQTDLDLVREGSPAILLMLDALVSADPGNRRLLMSGARAYATYAILQFEYGEEERAIHLSEKAKGYGVALLRCFPAIRENLGGSLDDFKTGLASMEKRDVPSLFWGAQAWATWIAYQSGSPAAMIDLPRVEQIMLRVMELDETFFYGGAHLFLGSYYGAKPVMYGGNPDKSRKHFERALSIGKRAYLPALILYADTYARTFFDRDLYEKLLQEVLERPLDEASELAASNRMAKMMASKRLERIDEYF